MDKALLPQELSGTTKKLLTVVVVLIVGFILVSILLAVIYGVGEYHGGFVITAIATGVLLGCTTILMNWMRQDKLEERVRYVTIAQTLALVVLSASLIAIIYGKAAPAEYVLGGTVSTCNGVTLQNNDGQEVRITEDQCGAFLFPSKLADGASFEISVKDGAGLTTQVNSGTGSVGGADSLKTRVICLLEYHIMGSVSGMTAGGKSDLVMINNENRDTVTVTDSGPFQFPSPVAIGDLYDVDVQTNPEGQTCTVAQPSGTVNGDVQLVVTCR